MIHQQDIRRVVGIRREIAEEPLAMAGRPVALEELDGPGVATLRSRL